MSERRFPAPWTLDEANKACFIVRDHNGLAVAYVYFESEPGRRAAAGLMTKDQARRIAANIAKLPGCSKRRADSGPLPQSGVP
jgi:endo-1,4-beta-D-glucanase Y